ncbi:Fur family transcriptional regulator [Pedomonas mirosovicensis]|uniref:Fur family transcriptional regulator n=1 Tax=Pedomonas mirosovicensis TaxID=2908641 RepID=UPI00216A63DC|nr:Fur family transcriptional regulator [Pedomonas mirosovicensis]MCH8685920.1 transcriptional repressor [Pedomonas mirosovicensis]
MVRAHTIDTTSVGRLAAAEAALERQGEQWTPLRQSVYEALASFEQPASAYDIAERVSGREGRRIAPNTVYRILDLFVATNLAKRIESRNAFLACDHPDHVHDCIFLVCDNCGTTTHIDDDGISGEIRNAAKAHGFQPEHPVIEVKGLCGSCSGR